LGVVVRSRRLLQQLCCAGALLCAATAWSAAEGPLRAGAARVDITPRDLKGLWMVWAKPFSGVHDRLYARAVVIDNGIDTAALVSTDLVEFGDTTLLRQRIQRELGIPADHILISATHDHNAPRAGPIQAGTSSAEGRPYSPPSYIQLVDDAIVEALKQAQASLQPARVGVGRGRADVNIQRYGFDGKGWNGADPDGVSDKSVWVVKLESQSGDTIALLMNYAVHSTVAGADNTLITGDLAGAAERFVERHYRDKAVALWTMGPAGDQNPRYDPAAQDMHNKFASIKDANAAAFEAMDAMGLIVGSEAILTANRISDMSGTARIEAGESVFSCNTTPPRAPVQSSGPPRFAANPDFHQTIDYPKAMEFHLGLVQINQIALAGVSGEIFTRIYQHLQADSPLANTILVTMSNGRIGYVGDDASYDGPFRNASVVRGCAEQGIVSGLVELMKQHAQ